MKPEEQKQAIKEGLQWVAEGKTPEEADEVK